jgi:hypothetical protein
MGNAATLLKRRFEFNARVLSSLPQPILLTNPKFFQILFSTFKRKIKPLTKFPQVEKGEAGAKDNITFSLNLGLRL